MQKRWLSSCQLLLLIISSAPLAGCFVSPENNQISNEKSKTRIDAYSSTTGVGMLLRNRSWRSVRASSETSNQTLGPVGVGRPIAIPSSRPSVDRSSENRSAEVDTQSLYERPMSFPVSAHRFLGAKPSECVRLVTLSPAMSSIDQALMILRKRQLWIQEAQARIEARASITPSGWQRESIAENAMSVETSRKFLESINRLERRYPEAVPQETRAVDELTQKYLKLDVRSSQSKTEIKNVAGRFIVRLLFGFSGDQYPFIQAGQLDRDPNTGLSAKQIFSIVWFAIHDSSIFSEQQREDLEWALLHAMASIQRTHNEVEVVLSSGRRSIKIDFSGGSSFPDDPSCPMGTFKRLLEVLDRVHPDVVLSGVTDSQASDDIRRVSDELFRGYSSEDQQLIVSGFPSSESFLNFKQRLRNEVLSQLPGISADQYDRIVSQDTLQALVGAY